MSSVQEQVRSMLTLKLGQVESVKRMQVVYDFIIEDFLMTCTAKGMSTCKFEFFSNSFTAGKEVDKSCKWQASLITNTKKDNDNTSIYMGMELQKYLSSEIVAPNIHCKLTCSFLRQDGSVIVQNTENVHFATVNLTNYVGMDSNHPFSLSYAEGGDLRCRIEMIIFGDCIQRNIPQSTLCTTTPKLSDADTVAADVGALMTDESSSDVVINCRTKRFRVHKLILSARSPLFAAMFRHGAEEVNMDDYEPEVVSLVLMYIYKGNVDELNDEVMVSVVQAAAKYGLLKLKEHCMNLLAMRITTENFASIAILSHTQTDGDYLKENLKAFYYLNRTSLRSSAEFREMVKEHPESFNMFTD